MLVFLKERLVFLAATRSASTSIEDTLEHLADMAFKNKPNVKHMRFQKYKTFVEPLLMSYSSDKFETCALIREPIDWLGSYYRYRKRPKIAAKPTSTMNVSFEQFVVDYLSESRPAYANLGRQSSFLTLDGSSETVNTLFRFDALPKFFDYVSDRLSANIEFPVLNEAKQDELLLSHETRLRLREHFRPEYDLYDSAIG